VGGAAYRTCNLEEEEEEEEEEEKWRLLTLEKQ
jgi:hypothetical protein